MKWIVRVLLTYVKVFYYFYIGKYVSKLLPAMLDQTGFYLALNPATLHNKILELDEIPGPMQAMGLVHSMPFGSFLDVVASTSDDKLDIHLLPQSSRNH